MASDEPPQRTFEIGDRLSVTIDSIAAGGDGVAHPDGFTLFIPYTATGEEAEVEVTRISRSYGKAKVINLTKPSPDRVAPPCPHYGKCAGCQLQHINYAAQLEAKKSFIADSLQRIGRISDFTINDPIGMENPWNYRNKAEFIAGTIDGKIRLGYHIDEDNGFLPVDDCPIQHPLSNEILRAVENATEKFNIPLAQLIIRVAPHNNEAMIIMVCWEKSEELAEAAKYLRAELPNIAGILWSQVRGKSVVRRTFALPLEGQLKFTQQLGTENFLVSAESFFQVNSEQAVKMLEVAREFTGDMKEKLFADLYCGVGTFLLPLARGANRSFGIEEHPGAIRDADNNLARSAIHNVTIYEGKVEIILQRMLRKGRELDVAIVDPPRKGVGRQALSIIKELGTETIIMISCDPATLARDLGDLEALGYKIIEIQPIDMFPQTWHIETIVKLEYVGGVE
jgi:23S rRNA (uracil1939-C5)-methyltransferase